MNEWQNLLLAVLLITAAEMANEVMIALFRVKNPTTRFQIRLISLLSCFFVFLVLPLRMVELFVPRGEVDAQGTFSLHEAPAVLASGLSRFAWISIVLMVAAVGCFVAMLFFANPIIKRMLSLQPAQDGRLLKLVREVSRELGVRVREVYICPEKCDAFVFGYPPSLAVGGDLLSILDRKELKIVIRHELYHVKERDTILRPVFIAFCVLFLYNPTVFFLYKNLFADRECSADRGAIISSQDTKTFLSALLKMHDWGQFPQLAVHWAGAARRIDFLFFTEKARKVPVLVCLTLTLSSLFVGGDHLFEESYLEIESLASGASFASERATYAYAHDPSRFLDQFMMEWRKQKNAEAPEVKIPLTEAELMELLKASEHSEGGFTVRVMSLPVAGRQLFGNSIGFSSEGHLVIDINGEGELSVSVEVVQPTVDPQYFYHRSTFFTSA